MLGDLFKSQQWQKYPLRKSKGLFSPGFILVTNLLVDVLVKKSVALCQCIIRKSYNELTFPNRYFIEVSRWVPLASLQYIQLLQSYTAFGEWIHSRLPWTLLPYLPYQGCKLEFARHDMLHKLFLADGWNEMTEITDDQAVLLRGVARIFP